MKRINLQEGSKYNKLTVLENIYEDCQPGKIKVICDCGYTYILAKNAVKRGDTKQCFNCSQKIKSLNRRTGIKELSGFYWKHLQKGAIKRNLEFSITLEEAYNLFIKQNKKCALTGLPLQLDNYKRCNGTASLDRIDSSKGYTTDNIQWIHKTLNRLKNKYSLEELLYWSKLLIKQQKILKKYIKDGETKEICPECGGKLIYKDGCKECSQCLWSKCG